MLSLAEKKKEIKKTMSAFCKAHEVDETQMGFVSENDTLGVIEHLSTGIIPLDVITNGGLIKGKVNVIYGGENAGKSTTVLNTIAEFQKNDPTLIAAICDNENVFDRVYAADLNVDLSRLIVSPAFNNAEQAYDFCIKMSQDGLVDVLVVDTIQALASQAEITDSKGKEKSTEDNSMALNISALL